MDLDDINELSLEYIELDGWKEKTKVREFFSELPNNAKKYISLLKILWEFRLHYAIYKS